MYLLARMVACFLTRHANIGLQHLCAKCKPQELRSWLQTNGFPTEAGNIGERKEGREETEKECMKDRSKVLAMLECHFSWQTQYLDVFGDC